MSHRLPTGCGTEYSPRSIHFRFHFCSGVPLLPVLWIFDMMQYGVVGWVGDWLGRMGEGVGYSMILFRHIFNCFLFFVIYLSSTQRVLYSSLPFTLRPRCTFPILCLLLNMWETTIDKLNCLHRYESVWIGMNQYEKVWISMIKYECQYVMTRLITSS